jgi:hypothetical protein
VTNLHEVLQEVNPSLADESSVQQTVAVGCSLVRSALGECSGTLCRVELISDGQTGETLL